MSAYFKRAQKRTTSVFPLLYVCNTVPSMLLYKLLFAAKNSHLLPDTQKNWAAPYLYVLHMNVRARQAVWFYFIFSSSSWGSTDLGEATCAVQLGNWTCLHRAASEPERCPASSAAMSLVVMPSRHWCASSSCHLEGSSHVTGEGQGGRVTVTCLFPASECREGAEDGP